MAKYLKFVSLLTPIILFNCQTTNSKPIKTRTGNQVGGSLGYSEARTDAYDDSAKNSGPIPAQVNGGFGFERLYLGANFHYTLILSSVDVYYNLTKSGFLSGCGLDVGILAGGYCLIGTDIGPIEVGLGFRTRYLYRAGLANSPWLQFWYNLNEKHSFGLTIYYSYSENFSTNNPQPIFQERIPLPELQYREFAGIFFSYRQFLR